MVYADLHVHTNYSDGTHSIEEVIRLAKNRGIKIVAITDHDTLYHYDKVKKICEKNNIKTIRGVEMSCYDFDVYKKVHVVGLWLNDNPTHVEELCNHTLKCRDEYHHQLIDELNDKGLDITYEEAKKFSPYNIVFKMHLFQAIVNKYPEYNNLEKYRELFAGKVSQDVDLQMGYIDVKSGIEAIHKDGGIAILAHPCEYDNYDEIKKKLEEPLVFEWGTGNEETTWRHFCNFNYEDIINKTKLKAIITRELDECYEILGDECLDKDFGELVMIRGEFASLFGELNKIINDYSKIISEMVIRNDYKVTDEKLKEYYEFLNIQPQIHEVNEIWQEVWLYADQNIIGKRLEKYSKDDAFMKKLQTIMEHDTEKHKYLFHGTQVLEDSPSILENGLLMMRKDLGSTTVKEMTQEELLLYERRRNDGKYWNRICCNN